ncbi:7tm 2 domain containing protein [Asbolus verrucosus]|uniref:7tm 2 domain containing protein n=1 Tax=Asbolus verrucosus TaxID=1661398 RepID=A0A482VXF0_ASBVE|nr:7tm 2 domain containing protein [Asbolus verrucosus]
MAMVMAKRIQLIVSITLTLTHQQIIPQTTNTWDDEHCPSDFTLFQNKCYVLNATTCPYHKPLPFSEIQDIAHNTSGCKLNITKNEEYDYYQWQEIEGNYGKLLQESVNGSLENVAVDYADGETFVTVNSSDDSYSYICAYEASDGNTSTSYCQLFDKICTNNTGRPSQNCHCRNKTSAHFCELWCEDEDKKFNETVCSECERILHDYKVPSMALSFDHYRSIIFISIKSYLKLLPLSDETLVYCFTDANYSRHDVTYRYNFSTIETYNDTYMNIYYYFEPQERYIGHYWCEAFEIQSGTIKTISSDRVIAEKLGKNNTESITMNFTMYNDTGSSYPLHIHEDIAESIRNVLNATDVIESVRFLHLYPKNYTSNASTIAYRLYLAPTNLTMSEIKELIGNTVEMGMGDNATVTLSPSYCLPETTETDNLTLTWDKTLLGVTTTPRELCLQSDRQPVTRTCLGEYLFGTYWSEVRGSCVNNSGELYGSNVTIPLHDLVWSEYHPEGKIRRLRTLVEGAREPIAADAHFMAQVFENLTLSSGNCSLDDLIDIANRFMDWDAAILKGAQLLLNSTDKIVYSIDRALGNYNCSLNDPTMNHSFFHIKTKNINVQVSKFADYNVTGAAFYASDGGLEIQYLTEKDNIKNLNLDNLELAAFVTTTQMSQIRKLNYSEARLSIVHFRNAAFFNQNEDVTVTGPSVGFYVDGFEEPFMYDAVTILIKPNRRYRATIKCASWNYGMDKLRYNHRGQWAVETKAKTLEDLYLCTFWHMSVYSILVGLEGDLALSIITIIGCVLSTLGGGGVITTSVVYQNWRENSGTKILINFVITMIFQNIVLAASGSVDSFKEEAACIFVGALLHYCVGAQFTWMLVVGYLQYQRYVTVFFTVGSGFVIKASVVAWTLPLVPVLTLLIIKKESYAQPAYCYPAGPPLYFGVFLPVSLILTVNIFVFALILWNICGKKITAGHVRDGLSLLHLRLMILLFFLLGLYWILGISARFLQSIALDYFFCIAAALQGLVIFLYFIVFNKMTRNFWMRQLRRSEMITSMQIWLQQRKKIGNIRLDRTKTRHKKLEMYRILNHRKMKD